ncbi:MAG: hypothetical protein HY301_19740 [Verrucomicrobia bacterium]|nr:hypothetical protein [Verrucomicrobiota bacterium]
MKRLPKEKRDRIILVAGVTVVALAAIGYCVIKPQEEALKARREKIEAVEGELTTAGRLASQADKIQKDLEDATFRITQIEDTMASGDMYSWIIKTMSRVQERHNVQIPNFVPPAVGEVSAFGKFPYQAATFSIRGTAHFHEVGKFIADLENTFPCARITGLELDALNSGIGSADSSGKSEKVTFKFEFVTLIKPNNSL